MRTKDENNETDSEKPKHDNHESLVITKILSNEMTDGADFVSR